MNKQFVYLILSEDRLIITENKINDIDYWLLFRIESNDYVQNINMCKTFCMGMIYGNQTNRKIVNNENEFLISQ
jgi:hypothetical protein